MNHVDTIKLNMDALHTGDYHVHFLSRHLDDSHLCDDVGVSGSSGINVT